MIEVEKKVSIQNEDELARLIEGAEFLREVNNHDVYFDNDTFDLTTKDWWLRTRDGTWELKIPLHKNTDRFADQYDELVGEETVRAALNEPLEVYKPFTTIKTTRRKYKNGQFTIDIDDVDYGDSTYRIGEIEVMVKNPSEIQRALRQIEMFVKKHELKLAPVRGKVLEYIHRKRPEHERSLIKAGVIAH